MKDVPHHLTKEHAEPIVVHHHDEETLLARWLRKGLQQGAGFWIGLIAAIAAAVALGLLVPQWLSRPSPDAQAWSELMVPSTVNVPPGDPKYEGMPVQVQPFLKIADDHPQTTAARYALLRAADTLYSQGVNDLPNQRVTARPVLAQAIEIYDRIINEAPADSPDLAAALQGKARALEARGDLDEAIAAYKLVAEKLPKTKAADRATARASELATPEARQFYKDFYEKDFSSASTPGTSVPAGLPGLGTPVPGGTPPVNEALKDLPALGEEPNAPSPGAPSVPAAEPAKTPETPTLPGEVFAPDTKAPATSPSPETPAAPPATPNEATPATPAPSDVPAPVEAPKA